MLDVERRRQSHARDVQGDEELVDRSFEHFQRDGFFDRNLMDSYLSLVVAIVLAEVDDERNGIIRVIDAVEFVDASSQETDVVKG